MSDKVTLLICTDLRNPKARKAKVISNRIKILDKNYLK